MDKPEGRKCRMYISEGRDYGTYSLNIFPIEAIPTQEDREKLGYMKFFDGLVFTLPELAARDAAIRREALEETKQIALDFVGLADDLLAGVEPLTSTAAARCMAQAIANHIGNRINPPLMGSNECALAEKGS